MRSKFYSITIFFSLITVTAGGILAAAPSGQSDSPLVSGMASFDNTSYIDANRIFMFVTNTGVIGRDLDDVFGYDYGTFFPYTSFEDIANGSNISSPLYASGLWIGGKVGTQIRVAIAEYSSEYVPGPMAGGSYQPDNPAFKVYRLYSDSMASNPNYDYLNWPVDQGAPVDGLGRPLLRGEQTTWTVFNDADPNHHWNGSGETDPLGIEVQQMIWGSNPVGSEATVVPLKLPVTQWGSSPFAVKASAITAAALEYNSYMIIVRHLAESGNSWNLINLTTGETLLENQTDSSFSPIQGLAIEVDFGPTGSWAYESADPVNISPVALEADPYYSGGRWFTGGNHGGEIFYGGIFMEPNFWGGTTVAPQDIKPVEIRFRPMASYTDLNGDGYYTIGEPYTVDDQNSAQNAFMYQSFNGYYYAGFYPIPFSVFDVADPLNPRQLNVVIRDRDSNHAWDLHILHNPAETDTSGLPNSGDLRYNYCWILDTDYDPTGTYYGDGTGGTLDIWSADGGNSVYDGMWVLWFDDRNIGGMLAEEGTLSISPGAPEIVDTFTFTSKTPAITYASEDNSSLYIEYKLYNKGGSAITDCHVSFWADPDLGGLADDLVGCDTLQDMFFCYNADNTDDYYFDKPPAIGYKVLAGPLVPSYGDTAVFGNTPVPNFTNLGMTAFSKYINGTDPDNYQQTYNYMRGLNADGSPYYSGAGITTYMVSGDPIGGTGDLDIAPADRRMMASFGPFSFNPGDSQYVLIKMSVAQGSDRLSSIALMKEYLNYIPGTEPDDPYTSKAQLLPEQQYTIFKTALVPVTDTLICGWTGADLSTAYLDSFRVNDSIVPTTAESLLSYEGFGGQVVRLTFPAADFIAGYSDVIANQTVSYSVHLLCDSSYLYTGTFQLNVYPRGDADCSGSINIGDVVTIISYIFRGGNPPAALELGNANSDYAVNIGDAVYLLNYIFRGGPPPAE